MALTRIICFCLEITAFDEFILFLFFQNSIRFLTSHGSVAIKGFFSVDGKATEKGSGQHDVTSTMWIVIGR